MEITSLPLSPLIKRRGRLIKASPAKTWIEISDILKEGILQRNEREITYSSLYRQVKALYRRGRKFGGFGIPHFLTRSASQSKKYEAGRSRILKTRTMRLRPEFKTLLISYLMLQSNILNMFILCNNFQSIAKRPISIFYNGSPEFYKSGSKKTVYFYSIVKKFLVSILALSLIHIWRCRRRG